MLSTNLFLYKKINLKQNRHNNLMLKKILISFTLLISFTSSVDATPIGTTADTRPAAPQQRTQWKNQGLNIQIGGTLLGGNIDFQSIDTSVSYNINFGKNQFFVDAANLYTKAGDNIIANRINGSALYAYNLLDNFNIYAYTTHTHDSSINLDYRLTNGLGVCLHKIASPTFSLFLISLGASTENEWFKNNIQEFALRSVLRLNIILPVKDSLDLGIDTFYTPALKDFSDYRLYGEAFAKFKINDLLSFKLSFADEYDSKPQATIKNNDYGVFGTLGFNFGY